MNKNLCTLLIFSALEVPYMAAANDYASGDESSLILKTTTTTGNYPAKYLNCGGTIAGSIRHENDRFEATEEWARRMKQQPGTRPRARKIRRVANDKADPA